MIPQTIFEALPANRLYIVHHTAQQGLTTLKCIYRLILDTNYNDFRNKALQDRNTANIFVKAANRQDTNPPKFKKFQQLLRDNKLKEIDNDLAPLVDLVALVYGGASHLSEFTTDRIKWIYFYLIDTTYIHSKAQNQIVFEVNEQNVDSFNKVFGPVLWADDPLANPNSQPYNISLVDVVKNKESFDQLFHDSVPEVSIPDETIALTQLGRVLIRIQ